MKVSKFTYIIAFGLILGFTGISESKTENKTNKPEFSVIETPNFYQICDLYSEDISYNLFYSQQNTGIVFYLPSKFNFHSMIVWNISTAKRFIFFENFKQTQNWISAGLKT